MGEQLAEALRAVVETARVWRNNESFPARCDLEQAVDALDALIQEKPNEPYGFILNRAWEEVHVGWFVKTPKGAWIEVVGNEEVAGGEYRKVTLLVNGNRATFTYPADRNVSIRKGTRTKAMDDAIKLLSDSFGGASVIQDWS